VGARARAASTAFNLNLYFFFSAVTLNLRPAATRRQKGAHSLICFGCESDDHRVIIGFGTGRQKMALERCTTPTLSRRTCRSRYGLPSWRRKSAGGAKRPRELVSHPESRILKPCSSDSQLHIAVCSSRPSTRPTSPQLTRVSGATVCSHDPRRQPHLTAASRIHHPGGCARLQPRRHFQLQLG
jgi:hypothetical protein